MDKKTAKLIVEAFNRGSLAHLPIDLQEGFYKRNPRFNDSPFRCAAAFARAARKLKIPNIWVHYVNSSSESKEPFHARPIEGELVVKKNRDSAFSGSDLLNQLKKRGVDTVLVSGVNAEYCVYDTVKDGLAQSDINFIILGNAVNYRCNGQYDSKAPPSLAEYEEEVQRQYGGRVQVTTTGDVVRLLQSRSKRDEVLNLEEAPKRKKGVWGQIISKVLG